MIYILTYNAPGQRKYSSHWDIHELGIGKSTSILSKIVCLLANSVQNTQLSYLIKKTTVSSFIATGIIPMEIFNKAESGVNVIMFMGVSKSPQFL